MFVGLVKLIDHLNKMSDNLDDLLAEYATNHVPESEIEKKDDDWGELDDFHMRVARVALTAPSEEELVVWEIANADAKLDKASHRERVTCEWCGGNFACSYLSTHQKNHCPAR